MKRRIVGLVAWLAIIAGLAALAHFLFGADWWTAIAFGAIGLVGNALLIQWEDRQPGGWSE
jgi:hypothetical protein